MSWCYWFLTSTAGNPVTVLGSRQHRPSCVSFAPPLTERAPSPPIPTFQPHHASRGGWRHRTAQPQLSRRRAPLHCLIRRRQLEPRRLAKPPPRVRVLPRPPRHLVCQRRHDGGSPHGRHRHWPSPQARRHAAAARGHVRLPKLDVARHQLVDRCELRCKHPLGRLGRPPPVRVYQGRNLGRPIMAVSLAGPLGPPTEAVARGKGWRTDRRRLGRGRQRQVRRGRRRWRNAAGARRGIREIIEVRYVATTAAAATATATPTAAGRHRVGAQVATA